MRIDMSSLYHRSSALSLRISSLLRNLDLHFVTISNFALLLPHFNPVRHHSVRSCMVIPRANYFERYPKASAPDERKDANSSTCADRTGNAVERTIEGLGIQSESAELFGLFPLDSSSSAFGSNGLSPALGIAKHDTSEVESSSPLSLAPNLFKSSSPRNRHSSRLSSPLRLKSPEKRQDDLFSPLNYGKSPKTNSGSVSPRTTIVFPSSPRSPRFSGTPSTNSDGTISPATTPYVASPSIFDRPARDEDPESTSSEEDFAPPSPSESTEDTSNRYRSSSVLPTSASSAGPTSIPIPAPPPFPARSTTYIKSIDDIIREYGAGLVTGKKLSSTPAEKVLMKAREDIVAVPVEASGEGAGEAGVERSSFVSIQEEALRTLELESQLAATLDKPLDFPRQRQSLASGYLPPTRSSSSMSRVEDDEFDVESLPGSVSSSPSRLVRQNSSRSVESSAEEWELATLLRSARLTRLITLKKSPNRDLVVSLADVGSPEGRPVLVFLGMGCVRYLIALYDELAKSLGLRLICIDRWGLGRSTSVPDDKRGYLNWASVVEEVMDQLAIDRFSLLAHSAGAPYALATALRLSQRIVGPIQLLAPWASNSVDGLGAYRYLRFIPSAVIKGVHEAEWKLQSLLLGKPPSIVHEPVGYNRNAPVSSSSPPASSPDLSPVRSTSATFLAGLWRKSPSIGARDDDSASIRSVSTTLLRSSTRSPKSSPPPAPSSSTASTPTRRRRLSLHSTRKTNSTAPSPPSSVILTGAILANGLLRASYAESMSGGTGDLMMVLSGSWGFDYREIDCSSKVWIGEKDDRITMSSIRAMQRGLKDCEVKVVKGADHGLMTSESFVLRSGSATDVLFVKIHR